MGISVTNPDVPIAAAIVAMYAGRGQGGSLLIVEGVGYGAHND
jgi:hypothetical protein